MRKEFKKVMKYVNFPDVESKTQLENYLEEIYKAGMKMNRSSKKK